MNSTSRRSPCRENGDKAVKERAQDVLSYVMEDAKKDFTITRFKGLGEMNPTQLWETTMNADTRTLLKVKLEDAVAAEDIFTTPDGRERRGAPQIHRGQRARSCEPGYLTRGRAKARPTAGRFAARIRWGLVSGGRGLVFARHASDIQVHNF